MATELCCNWSTHNKRINDFIFFFLLSFIVFFFYSLCIRSLFFFLSCLFVYFCSSFSLCRRILRSARRNIQYLKQIFRTAKQFSCLFDSVLEPTNFSTSEPVGWRLFRKKKQFKFYCKVRVFPPTIPRKKRNKLINKFRKKKHLCLRAHSEYIRVFVHLGGNSYVT